MKRIVRVKWCFVYVALFAIVSVNSEEEKQSNDGCFFQSFSNVEINGLNRVHKDVVMDLLIVKDGILDFNASIKKIYRSGIFSDVSINSHGNKILVNVRENPSIEKVAFEDNKELKDEMLKSIVSDRLIEGKMFNRATIQDAISDLQMAYKFSGFNGAVIVPKIIARNGNKVDVVFEISEGAQAKVSKVVFCGNKSYDSDALKDKMITKEKAIWRFMNSEVSIFGIEKSRMDIDALNRLYTNEGYADFKIDRMSSEIDFSKKNTYVTVMLQEGARFKINSVTIKSSVSRVSPDCFYKNLSLRKGSWYSAALANLDKVSILAELSRLGYVFVDVKCKLDLDRKNKTADILFEIVETPKLFIERIEIDGNSKTADYVIRRLFKLHEADPYCAYEIYRATDEIRGTDFFDDVNITEHAGSSADRVIVRVSVKEKESTSAVNLAFTLSDLDGLGGMIGYNDINFRGRGQLLSSDIQVAQKSLSGTVTLLEPRFLWDNVMGEIEIGGEKRNRKKEEHSDYKSVNITPSIIYNINKNLSHRVSYSAMLVRKVWVDDKGDRHNSIPETEAVKTYLSDEFGAFSVGELSSSLTYRNVKTYKEGAVGYVVSIKNALGGVLGNTRYFKNTLSGEYFKPLGFIDDKIVFAIKGQVAHIFDQKNVRSMFRFQPGGDGHYFRGFDSCGVGPRETVSNDSIGGTKMWAMSLQLKRQISGSDLGIQGSLFLDVGSVWGVPSKYSNKKISGREIRDDSKPRVSVGFAITWDKCPLGAPLSLIFAAPIKKSAHDKRRAFTLGI